MIIPWEWEHKCANNGNGKSTRDNGNENGYFLCVPKFPSVDSMRMQSNKCCNVTSLFCEQYILSAQVNMTLTVRDSKLKF